MKQLLKLFKPNPVEELVQQVNEELKKQDALKELQKTTKVDKKDQTVFELYGSDGDLGYC